jgi:tRNA modification GTPase
LNPKIKSDDTIAAIATAPGVGAIGIVRLSGEDACRIADKVFSGSEKLSSASGYTIHHGWACDERGNPVDEVLASIFRSPNSYTGEDVVEFNCHGGWYATDRLLRIILAAGARLAEPGEFTRRAFLNGKMELSQAEAVAEIIAARSERALELSVLQLKGRLGEKIREIRNSLLELSSLLEIDLDFSEEDISVIPREQVEKILNGAAVKVKGLLGTYSSGQLLRKGVRVVLVGPPNSGKSTLFNALLGSDRAITHASPGTTRDFIEESMTIDGVLFTLVDTAGLRTTNNEVEAMGIRRTEDEIKLADLAIYLHDSMDPSRPMSIPLEMGSNKIFVKSKADLLGPDAERMEPSAGSPDGEILVSALSGIGIDTLKRTLLAAAFGTNHIEETGSRVSSERHAEALRRANSSLEMALQSVRDGLTNEFVAVDVRGAISAVSEITGELTTEDILNGIFSKFCIGK